MMQPDRPGVLMADDDNPEMRAAMAKARATLGELRAHMAQGIDGFVKIPFEEGEHHESMWVAVESLGDENGSGTLSNDPIWITRRVAGDPVSFAIAEIQDWLCVVDGERKGGFTIPLLAQPDTGPGEAGGDAPVAPDPDKPPAPKPDKPKAPGGGQL